MRERVKRFEIPKKKGATGYTWKQYRYEPTGLLTLEITDYVADATRREWHEGKRHKLEEMLPEFIEGLAAAANARVAWHRKLEEDNRKRKQGKEQLLELERRKRSERHRTSKLLEQSNGYADAAKLRKLIADFRVSTLLNPSWSEESRQRWAAWAERIADRIDPFHNGYFSEELA